MAKTVRSVWTLEVLMAMVAIVPRVVLEVVDRMNVPVVHVVVDPLVVLQILKVTGSLHPRSSVMQVVMDQRGDG